MDGKYQKNQNVILIRLCGHRKLVKNGVSRLKKKLYKNIMKDIFDTNSNLKMISKPSGKPYKKSSKNPSGKIKTGEDG